MDLLSRDGRPVPVLSDIDDEISGVPQNIEVRSISAFDSNGVTISEVASISGLSNSVLEISQARGHIHITADNDQEVNIQAGTFTFNGIDVLLMGVTEPDPDDPDAPTDPTPIVECIVDELHTDSIKTQAADTSHNLTVECGGNFSVTTGTSGNSYFDSTIICEQGFGGDFVSLTKKDTFGATGAVTIDPPTGDWTSYTLTLPTSAGAADNVLVTDGAGNLTFTPSLNVETVIASETMITPSVQLAANNFTYDVKLQPSSSTGSNFTLTLPPNTGTNGNPLVTDGSGNLTFAGSSNGVYAGTFVAATHVLGLTGSQVNLQPAVNASQTYGFKFPPVMPSTTSQVLKVDVVATGSNPYTQLGWASSLELDSLTTDTLSVTTEEGSINVTDTMQFADGIEFVQNSHTITIAPPSDLAEDSVMTLPSGYGAPGAVLTTDGAGVLSWGNPTGSGTVTSVDVTSPNGTLSVAGGPITSAGTITIDMPTKIVDSGNSAPYNFFVGKNAGNTSLTGQSNVAAGGSTLVSVTTGSGNVAFGGNAAQSTTTGDNNTALGGGALFSNTDGANNVAVGYNSLRNPTSATQCVAVGESAGLASGFTDLTQCTFIGSSTDTSADGLTNSTAIGYGAIVGASNALVLGSGVSVGVNKPAPAATVHVAVNGDGAATLQLDQCTSTPSAPTGGNVLFTESSSTVGLVAKNPDNADLLLLPGTSAHGGTAYTLPYLYAGSGNPTYGIASLAAGTVTVSTTYVSTSSVIILSRITAGTAPGFLSYSITDGTSFVIASTEATDDGDIAYLILNGNF